MSESSAKQEPEQTTSARRSPNVTAPPPAATPQGTSGWMQKLPRWPWWVSFLAVLVANYFLLNLLFPPEPARVPISYTFFKEQVVADNVAAINSRGDTIQGTFRQAVSYQPEGTASATNARSSQRSSRSSPTLVWSHCSTSIASRSMPARSISLAIPCLHCSSASAQPSC